jgi:multiple sugar transport system substrate-binding protein
MKRLLGAAVAVTLAISFAGLARAQEKLVVWWNKGFYEAEDRAIQGAIAKWEQQSGTKVELSLFSLEDIVTKTVSAVEAGNPPDLAFGWLFDFRTSPKWAFDGKLEDVSDVVTPLQSRYLPVAVEGVTMLNGKTRRRAIYAVPIEQQTDHFHYWLDMLKDAGFSETDIPKTWHEFWDFWCVKVQPAARKKTGQRVYGIGLPESSSATDTFYHFYMFLNAYHVDWIDEAGKLHVDSPQVRDGFIKAFTDYTKVFKSGCTPAGSVNWNDADNNNNFHNRTTVSTPNPSLSIPGKWLDDKNEDAYYNRIRTVEFPLGPDGKPVTNIVAVKQAIVFTDSKNKKGAKSFISYLIQPENLQPYVEGALGRWYPVMPELANTPFWTDGKDPHKSVAHNQYRQSDLRPFPTVFNWKIILVQAENVWGRAIGRIVSENWSPEKAVDEMIVRIKELAG